jgi:DNA repair protein RadC
MVTKATTTELLTVIAGERAALAYCATGRLRPLLDTGLEAETLDDLTRAKLAALSELHRRITSELPAGGAAISDDSAAAALFGYMAAFEREEMHVAYLNRTNKVIAIEAVATGGLSAVQVTPQQVFRPALRHAACALILAHNHPSGSCRPSVDDHRLTQQLVRLGEQIEIPVIDHLVIGAEGKHYSFAQAGALRGGG